MTFLSPRINAAFGRGSRSHQETRRSAGCPWSGSTVLMMAQMRSRHEPQPVPAPETWPTASSVLAPARTTSATSLEVTAWQMQAYTRTPEVRGKASLTLA